MGHKVTLVITSSNRFDLLQRTLDSFLALNTYPIEKIVINEDSGNAECAGKIIQRYGCIAHVLFHPFREGLSKALDNLLKHVETEYVFTCEDDWLFEGNKDFIKESLQIMNNMADINQVWVRAHKDHQHPLGPVEVLQGVKARYVEKGYQGHWGGFSFNPALRRMSDIKRLFPNGFAEYGDEAVCSKHVESIGYRAVSLEHSACKHIGWNRHTEGFKP